MMLIELEDKIVDLVQSSNYDGFIFNFLRLYDIPNATIGKLQKGTNNLSKNIGEIHLKNKLYFKETTDDVFSAYVFVEAVVDELTNKPRYLFVTDYQRVLVKDTKTGDTLDIPFTDLPKHFDFFLAWNNIEKVDFDKENPADIKAAERFARIYDELVKENQNITITSLNLFLIRLLFCLFAEDTGIFEQDKMFTNDIKILTKIDGSDLNQIIRQIFDVLDKPQKTPNQPSFLNKYPYVNGHLFSQPHEDLVFNKRIRRLIIEAGELLNWSKVNPDILGSMLQTVATSSTRSHLGMHYTSVPNIMKVINPLFLDELKSEFSAIVTAEIAEKTKIKKLEDLLNRIRKIKFLDPACGSGNFLIITYKEMRRLEMNIYEKILEIGGNSTEIFYVPVILLSQFYGIEIDDFAHDVAMLSLWIADHQMNVELRAKFPNAVRPTLPLQKVGDIRCANALQIDWNEVCPHDSHDEVYVFGNPPYLGSDKQNSEQKNDVEKIFQGVRDFKKLDYIACWFLLGGKYINESNARCAFVSTNSITQGSQVAPLWKTMFENDISIDFAYTSFKWDNNARDNAKVIVVIIGISANKKSPKKQLIIGDKIRIVDNISPYLTASGNFIIEKANSPLFIQNELIVGCRPNDGGGLIFTKEEYQDAIQKYPEIRYCFRKFIGGKEFTNNTYRYCLWMSFEDYKKHELNPIINERIIKVQRNREEKKLLELAKRPYSFQNDRNCDEVGFFIPQASSGYRKYIPMGMINAEDIISDPNFIIYSPKLWLVGLLMSRMHMVWVNISAGKLKNDYRYSVELVYNTFPIPEVSARRKSEIEEAVMNLFDIRDEEGGTLAELYGAPFAEKNPKPMNERLQLAHEHLDRVVEKAYRSKPFENDEERLEVLLSMYQEMVSE
ncbi:N-6 DNA methylase [Turicibacter sanguinis]|nr:N-6 DNA methylase [Turicibacter sanguinis]